MSMPFNKSFFVSTIVYRRLFLFFGKGNIGQFFFQFGGRSKKHTEIFYILCWNIFFFFVSFGAERKLKNAETVKPYFIWVFQIKGHFVQKTFNYRSDIRRCQGTCFRNLIRQLPKDVHKCVFKRRTKSCKFVQPRGETCSRATYMSAALYRLPFGKRTKRIKWYGN